MGFQLLEFCWQRLSAVVSFQAFPSGWPIMDQDHLPSPRAGSSFSSLTMGGLALDVSYPAYLLLTRYFIWQTLRDVPCDKCVEALGTSRHAWHFFCGCWSGPLSYWALAARPVSQHQLWHSQPGGDGWAQGLSRHTQAK